MLLGMLKLLWVFNLRKLWIVVCVVCIVFIDCCLGSLNLWSMVVIMVIVFVVFCVRVSVVGLLRLGVI